MEKAPEHEPRDMRELIYRGVESEELDYKAAMSWTAMSRAARAKIVRHCLALANTKGGYGVRNINERLHLAYGAEYGLFCESEVGRGTRVTIRIPATEETEDRT